jgi:metal-dependent amidase/aminoacylase/carboxypeptidase family protein
MRGSEDFGRFGQQAPAAMFFLGAGENRPDPHNPDYDFPDELIAVGASVVMRTLRDLLG